MGDPRFRSDDPVVSWNHLLEHHADEDTHLRMAAKGRARKREEEGRFHSKSN
jgi:hypothetical protein